LGNVSDYFQVPFKTAAMARGETLPMPREGPPTGRGESRRADSPAGAKTMPKFVIEREIAGADKLSPAELKAISQKSCGVLSSLGPSVQWVESYVTADKIYCVYQAADESLVRRHAELGGFPANRISRVNAVIDPSTAE
jgi:Protein of unknown function (DUF4242)